MLDGDPAYRRIARRSEVIGILEQLDADYDEDVVESIVTTIESHPRSSYLFPLGGTHVKDWLRSRLRDWGCFRCGDKAREEELHPHGVGTFHFWPWDEARFGPKPTDAVGPSVDTMRSPLYRLRDSSPLTKVTWRTCGKGFEKPEES